MFTAGEQLDIKSRTEYREDAQTTVDGGDDASACGACPKDTATIAGESHQRNEESDTQDNKKPPIHAEENGRSAAANPVISRSSASSVPEAKLQALNKKLSSKTPKQTGKTKSV